MPSPLLRLTLAAGLAGSLAIVTPGTADAAPRTSVKCQIAQSSVVGGFEWRRMPTKRNCSATLTHGTSGVAQLSKGSITVRFSATRTSNTAVAKATVHELSHHVEYRTTAAQRAKLYRHLGIKNPSGNYFAFNDSYYYSGSLARWKSSPRERLAESVVNCTYGSPNHKGMKLVPRSQCKAFLTDFRTSLAQAR